MPPGNPKIDELRSRVQLEPNSRLFFPLAEELRKDGQLAEAETLLRDGLTRHATYLSAWICLGRVLRDQQREREAVDVLQTAMSLDPGNVVPARLMADAYYALGEHVEAIKKYKLIHALMPGDQEVEAIISTIDLELNPVAVSDPTPDEDRGRSEGTGEDVQPLLEQNDPSPLDFTDEPELESDGDVDTNATTFESPFQDEEEQTPSRSSVDENGSSAATEATSEDDPFAGSPSDSSIEDSTPVAESESVFEVAAAPAIAWSSDAVPDRDDHASEGDVFGDDEEEVQGVNSIPEIVPDAPENHAIHEAPIADFAGSEYATPALAAPADAAQSDAGGSERFFDQDDTALESEPDDESALTDTLILADLYASQGHREAASDIYQKLLSKDPDQPEVRQKLAHLSGDAPSAPAPDDSSHRKVRALNQWLQKVSVGRNSRV